MANATNHITYTVVNETSTANLDFDLVDLGFCSAFRRGGEDLMLDKR
jgi:hypothetical protein